MKTLFSIGETAKIHQISKQTLIYYDNIGLLRPCQIDPNNSYRYYSLDEFAILDVILLLKDLGVPLMDIQTYLKDRSIETSVALFTQQSKRVDELIKTLKHTKAKIHQKLTIFQAYDKQDYIFNEVFLERAPLRHVIEIPMKQPGNLLQFNIAMKRLMVYLRKQAIDFNYQLGSTTSLANIHQGLPDINDTVFTLIDKPMKDPYYQTIPAGNYVCIYFKGNYEDFSEPYRLLLQYIEKHQYTVKGPAYEFSITDMYSVHDSSEYITEIALKIEEEE